jgi:DNA-binding PadR family transcriptional regulator
MFPRIRTRIFAKGILRYLILDSLNDKPMHGYEIIKKLNEEFGGMYWPSAGSIYPILQALEDEGHVISEESEGKKTYTITPEGKEFLNKNEGRIQTMVENRRAFLNERKELNREIRNLASLIFTNYRDLEKDKSDAITKILKEARRKISDTIFE